MNKFSSTNYSFIPNRKTSSDKIENEQNLIHDLIQGRNSNEEINDNFQTSIFNKGGHLSINNSINEESNLNEKRFYDYVSLILFLICQ